MEKKKYGNVGKYESKFLLEEFVVSGAHCPLCQWTRFCLHMCMTAASRVVMSSMLMCVTVMSAPLQRLVCQEVNSKCFVPVCLTLDIQSPCKDSTFARTSRLCVFSSFALSPYPADYVSPGNAPPPFLPPFLSPSLLLLSGALSLLCLLPLSVYLPG